MFGGADEPPALPAQAYTEIQPAEATTPVKRVTGRKIAAPPEPEYTDTPEGKAAPEWLRRTGRRSLGFRLAEWERGEYRTSSSLAIPRMLQSLGGIAGAW